MAKFSSNALEIAFTLTRTGRLSLTLLLLEELETNSSTTAIQRITKFLHLGRISTRANVTLPELEREFRRSFYVASNRFARKSQLNLSLALFAGLGNREGMEWMLSRGAFEHANAAYEAAKIGRLDLVQWMNSLGIQRLNGVLAIAVRKGHREIVDYLLSLNPDLDWAFQWAAGSNRFDMMKLLIDKGNRNFNSALYEACSKGHAEMVEFLIQQANGFEVDLIFDAAAEFSAYGGNLKILQSLLKFPVEFDFGVILRAAAQNGNLEIVHFVLQCADERNILLDFDLAMIICATTKQVTENHWKIIELMLSRGANAYNAAMDRACQYGHLELVKFMHARGAANHAQPLITAAGEGHFDIIQFLIPHVNLVQHSADVNLAFITACGNGRFEIARYLMDLNIPLDLNGALTGAAQLHHLELVRWLIFKGANQFEDAMIQAAAWDDLEIFCFFMNLGVSEEILTNAVNGGLIPAAAHGYLDVCQFLMKHGANTFDDAIEAAERNGHAAIIAAIRQYRDSIVS